MSASTTFLVPTTLTELWEQSRGSCCAADEAVRSVCRFVRKMHQWPVTNAFFLSDKTVPGDCLLTRFMAEYTARNVDALAMWFDITSGALSFTAGVDLHVGPAAAVVLLASDDVCVAHTMRHYGTETGNKSLARAVEWIEERMASRTLNRVFVGEKNLDVYIRTLAGAEYAPDADHVTTCTATEVMKWTRPGCIVIYDKRTGAIAACSPFIDSRILKTAEDVEAFRQSELTMAWTGDKTPRRNVADCIVLHDSLQPMACVGVVKLEPPKRKKRRTGK